jgi:large subunit ribosomal protein L4
VSALSYKAKDKEVMVIDSIAINSPKTKEYLTILSNLKVNNKKTLLLTTDSNSNVYLSARNIPNAMVMNASDVNTYNILHANNIILEAGAIDKLKETLS